MLALRLDFSTAALTTPLRNFYPSDTFIFILHCQINTIHTYINIFDLSTLIRIEMCGIQSEETFSTIHHEMGHIQYYMNYAHQPPIFRVYPQKNRFLTAQDFAEIPE